MKLKPPFEITPRLAPGLRIADTHETAWLSFDRGRWILDLPDGSEHEVKGFYPPQYVGTNPLEESFLTLLAFLGACAESRSHAERQGKPPMDGDNSDLFPDHVGAWAQRFSSEIDYLRWELESSPHKPLIEP